MKKFAVFGNPIAQSLSPVIHQMFAKSCHLDIDYQKILVPMDSFNATVQTFFKEGVGCNVTVPFKEQAYNLVDKADPAATLAKAVNTIKITSDGELHGFNTDGIGLVTDLVSCYGTLKDKSVLLIGAGGAARGCVHPLLESGIKDLLIMNRTLEKAQKISDEMQDSRISVCATAALPDKWLPDVIVNSTSASLQNKLPGADGKWFANCGVAYDMVYGKQPTTFMEFAQEHGARLRCDGLGMLVEQAAAAFTIWTASVPSTTDVKMALRNR